MNSNNNSFSGRNPVLASFLACLFLGTLLWMRSDPPPYGHPWNEAHADYSRLVDIAHKWRSLRIFAFWDNEVGGGFSNFSSCLYPVLNPLNATAWFLSDDQYIVFFVVAPYVTGLFFTMMLLLEIFGVGLPYALFGALYYLGLGFARHTIIPESPMTLWGAFLLPAGVYFFCKYAKKDALWAFTLVGVVIAFQFASSGVWSISQNMLWWFYFIAARFLLALGNKSLLQNLKENVFGGLLLVTAAVGVFAVQFIPVFSFVINESTRANGTYTFNAFSTSWLISLAEAFIKQPMGVSMFGIYALLMTAVALIIAHGKYIYNHFCGHSVLRNIWLATALYFFAPSLIAILATSSPVLKQIFAPLTWFRLEDATNTLDFCVALTLAMLLALEPIKLNDPALPVPRKITAWVLAAAAAGVAAIPFVREQRAATALVLGTTIIAIACFVFRPKQNSIKLLLGLSLPFLGFMTTITSVNWNDKGLRTFFEEFQTETPEYQFFLGATGKYFVPFDTPPGMQGVYPLSHGVHAITGLAYTACHPIRSTSFGVAYHYSGSTNYYNYGDPIMFALLTPSAALTTYFPVEFTTILHGNPLSWPGFTKTVSGTNYDVWERTSAPAHVLFANHLKILPFQKIVEQFDVPFSQAVFVEEKDAAQFGVAEIVLAPAQTSVTDWRDGQGVITFNVQAQGETFAMIPTMYRHGWRAWNNGVALQLFPANYIFIGLRLPAGENHIEMTFEPPGFRLGIAISLITWGGLFAMWTRFRRRRLIQA